MSDTKFTPGPWRTKHGGQTIFIDASIGGGMAQEVAACGPTENWEQQAYNARLIAAAPELYASLCDAVQALEGQGAVGSMLERFKESLAKARGES